MHHILLLIFVAFSPVITVGAMARVPSGASNGRIARTAQTITLDPGVIETSQDIILRCERLESAGNTTLKARSVTIVANFFNPTNLNIIITDESAETPIRISTNVPAKTVNSQIKANRQITVLPLAKPFKFDPTLTPSRPHIRGGRRVQKQRASASRKVTADTPRSSSPNSIESNDSSQETQSPFNISTQSTRSHNMVDAATQTVQVYDKRLKQQLLQAACLYALRCQQNFGAIGTPSQQPGDVFSPSSSLQSKIDRDHP